MCGQYEVLCCGDISRTIRQSTELSLLEDMRIVTNGRMFHNPQVQELV